ncbi:short-chain fatty acyl-CoA regulator family protein [Streptomyces mirabilis]
MGKTYAGARLRRLREERRMSQAELARVLGISPSYLNQMEHDSRPLTVPVLLKLTEAFGVDPGFFSERDTTRLVADLREALAGEITEDRVSASDLADLASRMPAVATFLLDLGRRNQALTERLADGHGVRSAAESGDRLHHYDEASRTLHLSGRLRPGQRAFRLATQLALLEYGDELDRQAATDFPAGSPSHALARIGIANYFAAALILPYRTFHAAAEEVRYDIERLTDRYGLGYETVCHRLSTLQRPRLRGVPFSFVRVDRAGNLSKRQSATDFHFSRAGGTCPLWNVYEAFAAPGRIHVQIAEMPDGQRYLWTARALTRHRGGWGEPGKTYAIGLGCEIRHAARLVYADGLDLGNAAAATPIGMGCRSCERTDCPQRAAPPLGRRLRIDENDSTFVPYPVADPSP